MLRRFVIITSIITFVLSAGYAQVVEGNKVEIGRTHPKGIRIYGKGDDFNQIEGVGDFILNLSKQQVEKPAFRKLSAGFWNECGITLDKGQLEVKVNGVLRTVATGCRQKLGKIGFEASGSHIEYRNIVLITILSDKAK